MTLGEQIKTKREAALITQEELAEAVGIDRSLIARYETGMRIPPLMHAAEIAKVLGTTVDELLRGRA